MFKPDWNSFKVVEPSQHEKIRQKRVTHLDVDCDTGIQSILNPDLFLLCPLYVAVHYNTVQVHDVSYIVPCLLLYSALI